MELNKIAIKFYAETALADGRAPIDVFHRWIQQDALPGQLLIDVADYAHVPEGPGIVLIGHQADYAYDHIEGPAGFLAKVKRGLSADGAQARIEEALRWAVTAAKAFAAEDGLGLTLDGSRLRLVFNDRLNQPNDAAGFAAVAPLIEAAASAVFAGAQVLVERHENDGRGRLTVHVGLDGVNALA
ncbi:MAG: hypothetical protein ACYTF0_04550 [Planctomycetota bacterium]|jgi:hypothetical protein